MSTVSLNTLYDYSFHVPATGMTLAKYRDWAESDGYPEHGKVVYFQGELYFDMSPERMDSHAVLKQELNYTLDGINRTRKLGRYFPDGSGLQHDRAQVANEPDAMFAKWETIKSGRLVVPSEKKGLHTALVGTPDWVCEIVSDSSVEKDTEILRIAYHAAGIPEYWILDAREEEIVFQLLRWTPAAYALVPAVDGWYRSEVFGLEFQLTRHLDQVGWWQYELKSR